MPEYKADDFIKAIKGSKGNITIVAARLACSRQTVYNNLEKYVTVKQALEDERESMKDNVESILFKKIFGFVQTIGEGKDKRDIYIPPDTTAIIFYLKTMAKDRGYIERQEIYSEGGDISVNFVYTDEDPK